MQSCRIGTCHFLILSPRNLDPKWSTKRSYIMKINASYVIAASLAIILATWFFIKTSAAKNSESEVLPTPTTTASAELPEVIYARFDAIDHPNRFELYGRTEANRIVDVKAETAGLVIATPVSEGRRVKSGEVLCRQDIDARQASLDQATANLAARQFDLKSAQTLVDKGFRSAIQIPSLEAAVDGAKAAVKQAQIELDNVNMRAPFSGIFDRQLAQTGDYLLPGQPCGRLVDMNPLVTAIQLTEDQIGQMKLGQEVNIMLATGQNITGKLRFIEAAANPATRTFRAEIHTANPNYELKGGVTAQAEIIAGQTLAHKIPAKILTLDTAGTMGVRYLDDNNVVRFKATQTIDEDSNGIWVTGLDPSVRLITEGQDYVSVGTQVEARTSIYTADTP